MDEKLRRINDATSWSKQLYQERVKAVLDAEEDKDQAIRLRACQCKWCYYINNRRMAGAAFTRWFCKLCDREDMHSNTATPKVCRSCSEKYRACVSCGGDLNLATKRRNLTYEK